MATATTDIRWGRGRTQEFGRVARVLTSTAFLGLAVAALAWPVNAIVPGSGPDASWVIGLQLAHAHGLQFGTEFVWTYGPLGFLEVPVLADQVLWSIGFVYQTVIHAGVAVALLWTLRRVFPLPLAIAACYALLVVGRLGAAVTLLVFLWAFAALEEEPPPHAATVLAAGGGFLAAVELLGKANYGIDVFALALIALMGLPSRKRDLTMFLAVFCPALPLLWMTVGQDLSHLPAFCWRQLEIVSGYSSAMTTDILAADWALPAAIVSIVFLLIAVSVLAGGRTGARAASVALVAFFCFASFKQGFVRQGYGNTPEFFVLIAAAGAAVACRAIGPRRTIGQGLAIALTALALFAAPGSSLWRSLQAEPHLHALRESSRALVEPAYRQRLVSEARASMRATYRLDPRIAAALGQRPVQIDPWEIGIAWAYDLNWNPLPVAQTYSAYTPGLDGMNSRALEGAHAPAAILRFGGGEPGLSSASIDSRYPGWESPEAMRTMLCRYRATITTARFQLLERGPERCGSTRRIGSVRASTGIPIEVPAPPNPETMVFARINGIQVGGWEALRNGLYRARERTVQLDAGRRWRLVPATAADGLILRLGRQVDYPRPFALAPNANSITLRIAGVEERQIRVSFFAQRVDRPALKGPGRPADTGI